MTKAKQATDHSATTRSADGVHAGDLAHPSVATPAADQLRSLVAQSADLIVFVDPYGTITYANELAASFLPSGPLPITIASLFDETSVELLRDTAMLAVGVDGEWYGDVAVPRLGDEPLHFSVRMRGGRVDAS